MLACQRGISLCVHIVLRNFEFEFYNLGSFFFLIVILAQDLGCKIYDTLFKIAVFLRRCVLMFKN